MDALQTIVMHGLFVTPWTPGFSLLLVLAFAFGWDEGFKLVTVQAFNDTVPLMHG